MAGQGEADYAVLLTKHEKLKRLAQAAVGDYAQLQRMYDDNQTQYEVVKKRLEESELKLLHLQQVLPLACEEYNDISKKLEVEKACRAQAMVYASKMNYKFKRQSQMLDRLGGQGGQGLQGVEALSMPLTPLTDEAELDALSPSERNALNDKISVLENELRTLETRLVQSETERVAIATRELELGKKMSVVLQHKRMETELLKACQQLKDHEQAFSNFKKTSALAWGEFTELRDKYEQEQELKQQAELYAHKMLTERDASFRQSSVLLVSAASDTRLMHALLQIEDLSKQLETERLEHRDQVRRLEEGVARAGDVSVSARLQSELELSVSEGERLQRAVTDLEIWRDQLVADNADLRSKLDAAEEKLRPPPPPPPPPCPLIHIRPQQLTMKRSLTLPDAALGVGGARTPAEGGDVKQRMIQDAMQEMMDRIKSGKLLNPAASQRGGHAPSKVSAADKQPSAMNDLQLMLRTLKERRGGSVGEEGGGTAVKGSSGGGESSMGVGTLPPMSPKPAPPATLPRGGPLRRGVTVDAPSPPRTDADLQRIFQRINSKQPQQQQHTGDPVTTVPQGLLQMDAASKTDESSISSTTL